MASGAITWPRQRSDRARCWKPCATWRCDTRGAPLPAKITFIAEDERPPPLEIAGERVPYPAERIRQLVWTASGSAELSLEPGPYTVIASRDPDYELDVRHGVLLEPGASRALELVLERVLEHDGWLMMDSHLHGAFGHHGEVTAVERVITESAEGLDVAVETGSPPPQSGRPVTRGASALRSQRAERSWT